MFRSIKGIYYFTPSNILMKRSRKQNFWKHFQTQKAAILEIREIIDVHPFNMPFESELISDLIFERHYFCSKHKLRPSRFRKIKSYSCYSFEGDFSNNTLDPPIEWHAVSWTKCLKKEQTDWDRMIRAMRDRCEPVKTAYKLAHPTCEACKAAPAVEVHHAAPSFIDLTKSIRVDVEDLDIESCLSDWNWFHKKDFALPEGHKITKLFDAAHEDCRLESLCKKCHNKTKKKK